MIKLANKFDNFNKAVKRLNEANIAYKKNSDNDIYQDALIQRFEFTFELAWKTLREFMTDQGYQLEILSPKGVFAFALSGRNHLQRNTLAGHARFEEPHFPRLWTRVSANDCR